MSFLSKAFDNESIGFKCLIFLNLFVGGDPTKFSVNFRSLESISTNDLNYKSFLKIISSQGNKLDIKQFIQQLSDKKKTHPLKLYWKKKMPVDFKQIYDKKPKGKIYQYYLNHIYYFCKIIKYKINSIEIIGILLIKC